MQISGQKIPLTAGAAVEAGKLVKIGAADDTVIHGTDATDALLGVAEYDVDSGAQVTVQITGVAWVIAGGAVTRGDRVTAGAAGVGVAAAPLTGANAHYVGVALRSAVSGDHFPVLLQAGEVQGA